MIKVVVLDVTGNEATVMTDDGDIMGIRNRGYDIGQEINIKKTAGTLATKVYRFMPAVAAAAAVILLVAGIRVYATPYGTVSLDVNPSIEYTINRFDRVLNVSGVNEDGNNILAQMDSDALINKDIEDAVELTIEQIEADGYMEDEVGGYVVLAANTERENHTDKVLQRLDDKVNGHGNIKHMSFAVTKDELEEAHGQGISAGKKKMVDRLEEMSDEKIDRSEWNKRSVKDIVREYDRVNEEPVTTQADPKQTEEKSSMPSEDDRTRSEENHPAEERMEETLPPEDSTGEHRREQTRTEENRPAENYQDINRPEENRPEENRTEENRPEENRFDENRPEENRPEENRLEENRPEEYRQDDPGNRPEDPPNGHDDQRGFDPNF